MMWIINFIQKRPSDLTIRVWRIIFGLILSLSLYYNFFYQLETNTIESELIFGLINLTEQWVIYLMYFFVALWLIPIIMWATNICLFKKKYMRIIQIIFAIVLFYISAIIVEWASLDIDSLIALMWFLPLIAWITWKCITSNCMKYAEKITKIRV
jgi:hypothetical protein